jgi:sterol 3beta-glucosyltransferase
MRILLIGFGSRGDVQPLIPLGNGLKEAGYEVSIAAGSNFQQWIEDEGFNYELCHVDMEAVMNSENAKEWVENSSNNPIKEAQNMRRLVSDFGIEGAEDFIEMAEKADVLVSGLPIFHIIESLAQKFNKKHITILFVPMNPTRDADATMVPMIPQKSIFLNRLSGYIGQYFTHYIFGDAANTFRESIDLPPMRYSDYVRAYNRDVPVIYGLSQQVMPRPDDWREHIYVTGYWFHDTKGDWQASSELETFLKAGKAPVYIGFGSMSNKNPEATTRIMIDALKQTGQRGIIYTGWAGLEAEDLPEDIFLLDYAPHDWLFPRMAAVIHHGGAGTTAAGLRAGVPSAVVSHMADQPYWGRRIHELAVGAPLIRRHELSTERLADTIQLMINDTAMQERAAELGERIRQENGVANAVAAFDKILGNN